MTIAPGDILPDAQFMAVGTNGLTPMTTDDVFAGHRVALLAVPGAFTPTCSARHLPGFRDRAEELRAKGVDRIACVSVNDGFVMSAWAKDQKTGDDILMLADGNGDFARAVGLAMDSTRFGMGARSQRYSMLVNDKKVEKLFVEEGGEFRVSSVEHMLAHLD